MASRRGKIVYGSRRWKRVRREALKLANWRCSRCRGVGRLEVHHRHKLETDEGWARAFDISNLQVLCRSCHFDEHRVEERIRGADEWRKELDRP